MRECFRVACVILLALASLPLVAGAQIQLEFPPYPYRRAVQLPNGNRLLFGSADATTALGVFNSPVAHQQMYLFTLDASGQAYLLSPQPRPGGSGNDVIQAVAIDLGGNIWIAGETDSDDFTLVNPIVSRKVPYRGAGFVMELDPAGQKLLFATYLAGQQSSTNQYATSATAIAVDPAGNVYVGGKTNEPDFPTIPGAIKTGGGGSDSVGNVFFYNFLVKISPAGKLVFSTQLFTGHSSCFGGSACIAAESTYADVSDLAVDASGSTTLAGQVGGAYSVNGGYVARVAPDGSKLIWSTGIPAPGAILSVAMAQNPGGNAFLFGKYATLVATMPGLQPAYLDGASGLFAAELSSDGATWIYTTDLGLSPDAHAAGIALDSSGNAYLAGTTSSPQFPALTGVPNLGADFVLRLDASGARAQKLFRFPAGTVTAPPAFAAGGRLMLPGSHGSLLSLPPSYAFDTPAIVAFANSASYELNTGLYPGALVSLFGFDLPSSSQGVQVLIGAFAAPILYAGPNQINIQVPFESPTYASPIQLTLPSVAIPLNLPFSQSTGIFTSDGVHAAALNQDGSVNSSSNPAIRSSIVTVFGTGAAWPAGMTDGAMAAAASVLDPFLNPFVGFDTLGTPVAILYAGTAPGILDGVFQMNLQLPATFLGPLTLQVRSPVGQTLSSNSVQLYVK